MITNIITQVAGQQQPVAVTTIVKCELPECPNTATFDVSTKDKAMIDNPWLRTYRTVQTGDGRTFGYCGDACELAGVASGKHNIPEPKRIIDTANAGAVAAVAQQVAAAKAAEQAIREGKPANIQVTDK